MLLRINSQTLDDDSKTNFSSHMFVKPLRTHKTASTHEMIVEYDRAP